MTDQKPACVRDGLCTLTGESLTSQAAWSLSRDLRKAATELGDNEVRYLVDSYYGIQDFRKQASQRLAAAVAAGEPNELTSRLAEDAKRIEANIKYALGKWGENDTVTQWARSIMGIGPVIAAGLAAHIDISHCPAAGHIWSYAGLNPEQKWEKGQKRPWNAALKTLCWKAGESFVKVSNNPRDVYGHVYKERRELEGERNEAGQYARQAAAILASWPSHKQAAIYKEGKLPDGHLHSRAKRYAVKLFLAHYHHVLYETANGVKPPKPYIIEHGGHTHYIAPPNWPMMD